MFDWPIFNWLRKPLEPVYVPPLTVEKGEVIHGRIFPCRTKGFVKFDYKIFANINWTQINSTWEKDTITWDLGELQTFNGHKIPRKMVYIDQKIHPYWKRLGYLPCYTRIAYISLPKDDPICKNVQEYWPTQPTRTYTEDEFLTVVYGKIAIHEYCKPIVSKINLYEHDFFTTPTTESQALRYYPQSNLTMPFISCYHNHYRN